MNETNWPEMAGVAESLLEMWLEEKPQKHTYLRKMTEEWLAANKENRLPYWLEDQ